uniref:Interleukin-1 family member 10 n=1 Tax=Phocoena sinus TaxID=42100 RepID=A0A8C9C8S8_PHOSS
MRLPSQADRQNHRQSQCQLPADHLIKDADQKALCTRDRHLLVGDPAADNCRAGMICILPNRGLGHTSFPVFLGIQGGSRCLACVETGEGPSLQLEVRDRTLFWGPLQTWPGLQGALASLRSSFPGERATLSGPFLAKPQKPHPVRLTKKSEPSACTELYFEQSR